MQTFEFVCTRKREKAGQESRNPRRGEEREGIRGIL
jgi:hypothetical protein